MIRWGNLEELDAQLIVDLDHPSADVRGESRWLLLISLRNQGRLKEALLSAYFVDTANVADHDTLLRIASEVGLDEVRVKEVLTGTEYADAVEADIREAVALGSTGVPFYVIDRKYGIAGAQPTEVFTQVLERAWGEAHPKLDLVAGADACGPDGCAI